MSVDEALNLFAQSVAQVVGVHREVKIVCRFRSEHLVHSPLQSAVIILQCEVQDGALSDGKLLPERNARADVVGKLRHQEALSQLRRSYEQIHAGIEQAFHNRRFQAVNGIIQLVHRDCVNIFLVKVQILIIKIIFIICFKTIAFFVIIGYTITVIVI